METLFIEYRPWISLIWAYCGICFLYKIAIALRNWIISKLKGKQWEADMVLEIKRLPPEEKEILSRLIQCGRIWLPMDDPAVSNLLNRGLLTRITGDVSYQDDYQIMPGYWYRLQSRVRDLLER